MEAPLLVLKPSIFNVVVSNFVRDGFLGFLFGGIVYAVLVFLNVSSPVVFAVLAFVVVLLIPSVYSFIILSNIKYFFYRDCVVSEFRLFSVKRHSVLYHQIANITLGLSVWDRLSNVGDIILHTSKEGSADLILRYMKSPERIEHALYQLISRRK